MTIQSMLEARRGVLRLIGMEPTAQAIGQIVGIAAATFLAALPVLTALAWKVWKLFKSASTTSEASSASVVGIMHELTGDLDAGTGEEQKPGRLVLELGAVVEEKIQPCRDDVALLAKDVRANTRKFGELNSKVGELNSKVAELALNDARMMSRAHEQSSRLREAEQSGVRPT